MPKSQLATLGQTDSRPHSKIKKLLLTLPTLSILLHVTFCFAVATNILECCIINEYVSFNNSKCVKISEIDYGL